MELNTLDQGIIVVLIISGILGYKKGMIASLGGIISTLIGLGVAILYRNEAASYLQEHYGVVSKLTLFLEKRLSIPAWGSNQAGGISSLPAVNEGLAYVHMQFTEFALLLVVALSFLLLYIISSLLIKIFCVVLEKMLNMGKLGVINRTGGAGIILAKNIVIMAMLLGVLAAPLGLGSKIGIKTFYQASGFMEGSCLAPYLMKVYAFLQALVATHV